MIASYAKPKLAVLISGGGTTVQNLMDCIQNGELHASIEVVISSRPDAFGVERAKQQGLPVQVITPHPRGDFSDRVFAAIRAANVDLVIMGGWLQLLPIPDDFRQRVLNIHPSLLPAFGGRGMYGHHVHEAVFASGVKVSGCTVHFVDDTYDTGPIILQRAIDISHCQTPAEIAAEVFMEECLTYPDAIGLIASGKWRVEGRRVFEARQF